MFKNKIFLAIAALLFAGILKAQTITIDDARFDQPGLSYAIGGSVAVPVTVNSGCLFWSPNQALTNKMRWQICNAAGVPIVGAGMRDSIVAHYVTFINVKLPATLINGNQYTIRVSASTPGIVDDITNPFTVSNAVAVNANAVPVNRNRILRNQYYYGRCDGNFVPNFSLIDSSASGVAAIDSFELIDNYRPNTPIQKYVPDVNKLFNLNFTPTQIGTSGISRDAYYTGIVKSINGTVVSTKAYHIINSRWAVQIVNVKDGVNKSYCKNEEVGVRFILDTAQISHLSQNFPASIIRVDWGDNTRTDTPICAILAAGGVLRHNYAQTSCQRNNQSQYNVVPTIQNPFYSTDLNTVGCLSTTGASVGIQMNSPAKAKFLIDSVICGNGLDSLIMKNVSEPGQSSISTPVGSTLPINCDNLNASYTWLIDSVFIPKPYYQTPADKLEPRKDTSRKFLASEAGYHKITLIASNNNGDDKACPSSDTTMIVCVDTATIVPKFKMVDSSSLTPSLVNDTIVACSPSVYFINQTNRTLCLDSTHFRYIWSVHDATKPFDINAPMLNAGNYTYLNGTHSFSMFPAISFSKAGKYFVALRIKGKCDTTAVVKKYIEATGEAGIRFSYDTVFYCGFNSVLPSYNLSFKDVPVTNTNVNLSARIGSINTPITIDSVKFQYDPATVGTKTHKWVVLPNTLGAWSFIGGTTDTDSTPIIQFNQKGIYTIIDTFKNNCAQKGKVAKQVFVYQEAPQGSVTSTTPDTLCQNSLLPYITVSGFAVTTAIQDSVRVTWVGDGTFSPATGIYHSNPAFSTPNILTPRFTPSNRSTPPLGIKFLACNSANGLSTTITMQLRSATNIACISNNYNKSLFITKCITSSNRTTDICSGSSVNWVYPGGGIKFRYSVSSVQNIGASCQPTNSGGIYVDTLKDVLCVVDPNLPAYVDYLVNGKIGSCDGDDFILRVNVNPIPLAPGVSYVNPQAPPLNSFCSGDNASFAFANSGAGYSWTTGSLNGFISGNNNGTNQPAFPGQTLINSSLTTPDTVWYKFSIVSSLSCKGPEDSVAVIVRPGHPQAVILNKLIYGNPIPVCDSSCIVLKGNNPTFLGVGTWSYVSSTPPRIPSPTLTQVAGDSTWMACDLQPYTEYKFRYEIAPNGGGSCKTTSDEVSYIIIDTVSNVSNRLKDTIRCDVSGLQTRTFSMTSQLSRPQPSGELYSWRVLPSTSTSSVGPNGGLSTNFTFTNPGIDTVVFCAFNIRCPQKCDTTIVRLYKPPVGVNNLSLAPSQPNDRYCQGSSVSVSAALNPKEDDMYYWIIEDINKTTRVDSITNVNPLVINNLQQSVIVTGVVRTKGWAFGCGDTALTISKIIYVDSPSIAGTLSSNDTIVCTPGNKSLIKILNSRGDDITWVASTTCVDGTYSLLPGIPSGSKIITPSIPSTICYKAYVKNGNCPVDSTSSIKIFIPTASGNATIFNKDTAVCGVNSITLTGNTPIAGIGYWSSPIGYNNPFGNGVNLFPSTKDTALNPITIDITSRGTYTFQWTIKNFSCPASNAKITVINNEPIGNNNITATTADTVCKGTPISLSGTVPTGGGYLPNSTTSNIQTTWEISKDGGATWTSVGSLQGSYTFPGDTSVKVRRYLTSDSCKSYSNVIDLVVHQPITNNTIAASSQVCTGTIPNPMIGSVPTGGTGTYTYAWDTASMFNAANNNWTNANTNTINYSTGVALFDSLSVRRIVTSGKCTSISNVDVFVVNPNAKATFNAIKTIDCAPFQLSTAIQSPTALINTNYTWYWDTVGGTPLNVINTGAGFGGYAITKGLDSVRISLIATSTYNPVCNSDTLSVWFKTFATPFANFTISADSGCGIETANGTAFTLTNTTPNKSIFPNHNWALNAFGLPNYNGADLLGTVKFEGDPSGLDKVYSLSLTVGSFQCGNSTVTKPIKIRTKPKVKYIAQPTTQCSGGVVKFYDQSIAVNASTAWIFGDAGNTIGSATPDSASHLYTSTQLTSYNSVLKRQNECDVDSAIIPITIDANTNITVVPSVLLTDKYQCAPATVRMASYSSGGIRYQWEFEPGQTSGFSTKGSDTVTHTFTKPGKYLVSLTGYTLCGSVTNYDTVYVYGTPNANFTISPNNTICKGDTAKFIFVDTFTTRVFDYGNGTGSLNYRVYLNTGTYNVQLMASNRHTLPLGGSIQCFDTSFAQTITVKDSLPGTFVVNKIGATCVPDVFDAINKTNVATKPYTTTFSFGTPLLLNQIGDSVRAQYDIASTYNISMVITGAKGCIYTATQPRVVIGPFGSWMHDTGYKCGADTVHFSFSANNADSIAVNFGDGYSETFPIDPTFNSFYYIYAKGGTYYPTATLISNAGTSGCTFPLANFGPIRVDYVTASFRIDTTQNCGNTVVRYINTSTMDQSPNAQQTQWTVNGNIGRTRDTTVTYFTSSTVADTVKLMTTSVSGCKAYFDTVVAIKVFNIPSVLSVNRRDTACLNDTIRYETFIAPSEDPITKITYLWGDGSQLDNGTNTVAYKTYGADNIYTDRVLVNTTNCSFTYTIPRPLRIFNIPTVGININPTTPICYGVGSTVLTASASATYLPVRYVWSPNFGITGGTTSTQSITVSPTDNITYTVNVYDRNGCTNKASQAVQVIQPYTLKINDGKDTAICNGATIRLNVTASDGTTHDYRWINPSYIQPDTAQRDTTTIFVKPPTNVIYIVEDRAAVCPDPNTGKMPSASIQVLVGDSFKISFAADTVYLQAGSKYTFTPNYGTQDSMKSTVWSPDLYFTSLGQSTKANPEILVTDNMCYNIKATSIYNCSDEETVCVRAFCEASQVFIPNTFTPDGNGQNDRFYVTANGINRVVSFRVFNRWGQVVYERANYQPSAYRSTIYNPAVSWDGKFNGVIAPTDTYVYTCEVECQNGTRYTYTGSVALIK